jgi:cytochrome c553
MIQGETMIAALLVIGVNGVVASAVGTATLSPAKARGNPAAGKDKAVACAGCHGADGNGGANPAWPKLAGGDVAYLTKQLADFKSGARKDPVMSALAAPLGEQDVLDLAVYFASLPRRRAQRAAVVKDAERIYRSGVVARGVTACATCHGPKGRGAPPRYPRVSGQSQAYLQKQLLAFRSRARANDGDTMTRVASPLSETEIAALAGYVAGL